MTQTALVPNPDPSTLVAVALSLIRAGENTKPARMLKELVRPAPQAPPTEALLRLLADALQIPTADRASCIRQALDAARQALAGATGRSLTVVSSFEASYPPLLTHIPDPPIVLWLKGDPQHLSRPAVAIVGSRAATPTGLSLARQLARELAEAGLTIVSGLARGIDGAAHEGALDAGGVTIGVLGCGADVVYPPGHARLAGRVAETGALVSELPPGTPPLPHHFPLRNRIISGLSRAVVIVEAHERSGSLITAKAALEQGRDVLAVPGSVMSGCYRGCHALIRDGARLVEKVEDVLEEIGWSARAAPAAGSANSLRLSALEETMTPGEPYSVDELSRRTGRATPALLAELATLELAGRVSRLAGGSYLRLDTADMNKRR